ncbi:NAD(P)/FAD-dependent oxidoreductase [Labedaea rhizosphaerae]|uniref:NADPH-dependent 2,4-dienoyl-CoA reductase/sulfur reductase-like enzyme n=1 Tax=Labedaea rhizosphaerae TaxID=598644 RepID=A0A4R6SDN0_LABRH|nr:FAD-dependent oxidoreductase [Labedaea rhizosphaerae]TDP97794.1 NADPH-dependent 2,4-dienoyl-CoA reductase/sulfur reductase-like enzyme [Labedaea rhizosphaerae]
MTIAIVGGGLAGATVATELRERGHEGPVTIYAAEPHLPYERPPLSKGVLLGNDEPDSVFVHDLDWYREHDVVVRRGTRVTAIDPARHVLGTADGEEPYEKLVLATGSSPRRMRLADECGKPVVYLRTIEDSRRLREALSSSPSVAIVGGGWIGLEVAAAARSMGCAVAVFEMAEQPLHAVLGPEIGKAFADLHRGHGVDLRLGAAVTAADLAAADLVVVGIGAVPSVELAADAGLAVDNGVLVDATLRTSSPDVFAIGDIANHDHPVLGHRVRVEHWDNAIEQGKTVAHNLLGDDSPYERQPYFFTDQYDLGMEYVGHVGPAGYDEVTIEGDLAGAFRAYWQRDGVVVAAMHANDWDASDAIRASIGTSFAKGAAG